MILTDVYYIYRKYEYLRTYETNPSGRKERVYNQHLILLLLYHTFYFCIIKSSLKYSKLKLPLTGGK